MEPPLISLTMQTALLSTPYLEVDVYVSYVRTLLRYAQCLVVSDSVRVLGLQSPDDDDATTGV